MHNILILAKEINLILTIKSENTITMKRLKTIGQLTALSFFFTTNFIAQTISWSGYPSNTVNTNFNSGTAPNNMTAVVTANNVTRNDNTPRYISPAFATTSGTPCYISGLALNAGKFNSYVAAVNSNMTVTMTFNPTNVGSINGTCNSATFSIRDINSDEGFTTFLDVVEISAVDGNGNPIPTASITTTLPSRVTRVNSGSMVKLVGHNSANETTTSGPYSGGQNCGDSQIKVDPGANNALKSITIKYRPGYGTSTSNAYYDINPKPAVQYISISDIVLNSVGTCPTPLSIELSSFTGKNIAQAGNLLKWETASETNNSHFELQKSTDGKRWDVIETIKGAGTTDLIHDYQVYDDYFNPVLNYYRLNQVDFDGKSKLSDIVAIDNSLKEKKLIKICNVLGQEVNEESTGMKIYIYSDGSTVKKVD